MHKIMAVAMREYKVNVKSRAFLVGLFLMPVFMFGSVAVQRMVEKQGDRSIKRVAVIDHTKALFDVLKEAAERRNKEDIFDAETGRQREATFELFNIAPDENRQAQLLDLSEQVRADKYFAFVEIPETVFDSSLDSKKNSVKYYSNQSTYRDLPEWLWFVVGEKIKAHRFSSAGLDREMVMNALAPVEVERFGLLKKAENGEIKDAEEANPFTSFMIPFGTLMMMFMLTMLAVQPLLQGVLEEKMQRISELLLGSVKPFELMMGKLIGHTLIALTLLGIYAVGGYFAARKYGIADSIDPTLVVWAVAFLTMSIFMYGSLFLAAGSCCNDAKEAQSLILPVSFPMILPMLMLVPIIKDPNGTLAMIFSFFPFTSPMIMTMRKAMDAPIPIWQAPVAMAGCIALTLICVWAAGRIFRVGLLLQGKPPKLSDLVKWAVRG